MATVEGGLRSVSSEDDAVSGAVRSIQAAAVSSRISQPVFDAILSDQALPARCYRALSLRLQAAGITVEVPAAVVPLDAELEKPDPGWNAVGQDHFMQRNWHDLLTPAEEHELGVLAQRGRLARQAIEEANAPPDGQRALRRQVKEGERAEERMVLANLRLVTNIAWKFKKQGGPAMEFDDLFQEGVIGLSTAIAKFDPNLGYKLSTYATWWIRQAINRAIADKARSIRLPVHKWEEARKVWKAGEGLRLEGLPCSPADIARRLDMSVERVRECERVSQPVRSLDRPVTPGGVTTGELLASPEDHDPAAVVVALDLERAIGEALRGLSTREKLVISLRFGLDDGQKRTLEEVGQEFGVTRERIRQIEAKALAKLRNPAVHGRLAAFVDFCDDLEAEQARDLRRKNARPIMATKEN